MKSKEQILDEQHWVFKDYRQRILTKDWREILLNDDDKIFFEGHMYQLKSKNLGVGVVEIWKNIDG